MCTTQPRNINIKKNTTLLSFFPDIKSLQAKQIVPDLELMNMDFLRLKGSNKYLHFKGILLGQSIKQLPKIPRILSKNIILTPITKNSSKSLVPNEFDSPTQHALSANCSPTNLDLKIKRFPKNIDQFLEQCQRLNKNSNSITQKMENAEKLIDNRKANLCNIIKDLTAQHSNKVKITYEKVENKLLKVKEYEKQWRSPNDSPHKLESEWNVLASINKGKPRPMKQSSIKKTKKVYTSIG